MLPPWYEDACPAIRYFERYACIDCAGCVRPPAGSTSQLQKVKCALERTQIHLAGHVRDTHLLSSSRPCHTFRLCLLQGAAHSKHAFDRDEKQGFVGFKGAAYLFKVRRRAGAHAGMPAATYDLAHWRTRAHLERHACMQVSSPDQQKSPACQKCCRAACSRLAGTRLTHSAGH